MIRNFIAALSILICWPAGIAMANDTLRIATFNVEFMGEGPGLALRDIRRSDAQMQAIATVISETDPDVLAIQGLDYDFGLETLKAFNKALRDPFDHLFALPTNRGLTTGLDMNGDGRFGQAADAQGFGRFYGQGAMALLSRLPINRDDVRDFTSLRWVDVPGEDMPRNPDGTLFPTKEAALHQRLSSSSHWIVPIRISDTRALSILTFHAAPPVFDGPEDRNGRRNAAEITLWRQLLDGEMGQRLEDHFVIAGSATLDPFDSDGRNQAIRDLLNHPKLQDTKPRSDGAASSGAQGHRGEDALDTVDWEGVGRLRVDYVLPSMDLSVAGSGVYWPSVGKQGHADALRASRHRLVWVDVTIR